MSTTANKSSTQYSLRSLLMGMVWLAFILAICAEYYRTTKLQRETFERLKAAGFWPQVQVQGFRVIQPDRASRRSIENRDLSFQAP